VNGACRNPCWLNVECSFLNTGSAVGRPKVDELGKGVATIKTTKNKKKRG
jgi:hypothetical protein